MCHIVQLKGPESLAIARSRRLRSNLIKIIIRENNRVISGKRKTIDIFQLDSIKDVLEKEAHIIARIKPKYNKQGK